MSARLKKGANEAVHLILTKFETETMRAPHRFPPSRVFLKDSREKVFVPN